MSSFPSKANEYRRVISQPAASRLQGKGKGWGAGLEKRTSQKKERDVSWVMVK